MRTHAALRWLHIYTSMISLLIVLFFSVTGVLLNHPDWTLGSNETRHQLKGTLPQDWKSGNAVDWLRVSDYLKKQAGLSGTPETSARPAAGTPSASARRATAPT